MVTQAAVCTLFEGHYHFGVAALINSLHKQGFKGDIYAGYRGSLPPWINFRESQPSLEWEGSKTYIIDRDIHLHFLPLSTDYHFTNYKPDFMLLLWQSVAKQAKQMFYFDPDIVITSPWSNFEKWVTCGIAVCEDVNSPLAEHHPRRVAWRRYFSKHGVDLQFKSSIYVNGGFVGAENPDFLLLWKKIQELMAPNIGGLQRSSLKGIPLLDDNYGPFAPFSKTDQDALNAALEAWSGDVSFLGQEGMAFKPGAQMIPHALGQPKPWKWRPLWQVLNGTPPRLVDREYWQAANGIIISQPAYLISLRKYAIVCAAFIGRFYRRGLN